MPKVDLYPCHGSYRDRGEGRDRYGAHQNPVAVQRGREAKNALTELRSEHDSDEQREANAKRECAADRNGAPT
jgi:hypothetical protein